jgi:class 3 adenylate cyclase/ketosteroid isomerase-like protein
VKPDKETEAAVIGCVDSLAEAYSRADTNAFIGLFAPDPEVTLIGTGRDERVVGISQIRALIERDWSQTDAATLEHSRVDVWASGYIAWIDCDLTWRAVQGGEQLTFEGRMTAVLAKRRDKWLFVQMHVSLPAAGQDEGSSWPTPVEAVAAAVNHERPDLRPQASPDGLVTLLFTDIQDSTLLNERLGDIRWIALIREHNAIVRDRLQAHGGIEVKTIGDAFMACFSSARRAVLCAIDIQRAFSAYNREHPSEEVRVRMGLHAGEPVREGGDFYGKSVVLASRVTGEALGGEILVSGLLHELVESAGDIQFGEARQAELKGLSGPRWLYQVVW